MNTFSINLSEKKFSPVFFENVINNPGEYFMKIRRMINEKELPGIIQFNKEIHLCRAAQNSSLTVLIEQRRGYKKITFNAENKF